MCDSHIRTKYDSTISISILLDISTHANRLTIMEADKLCAPKPDADNYCKNRRTPKRSNGGFRVHRRFGRKRDFDPLF